MTRALWTTLIAVAAICAFADNFPGTDGDDFQDGTDGKDQMHGKKGNDTQEGKGGDDVMNGGDGDDAQNGHEGNDTMHGGKGRDTQFGGNDDDKIAGGRDNDNSFGGGGNDTFAIEPGDAINVGQQQCENIDGGAGNDTIIFLFDITNLFQKVGDGDYIITDPVSFPPFFTNGCYRVVGVENILHLVNGQLVPFNP